VNRHRARRRFGQNFLIDDREISRIVTAIEPRPVQHLVEIGPGHGALTGAIAAKVARLDVIEIDRDLVPDLEALTVTYPNLTVHCADALRFDFATLACHEERLRIFGNLPYNISTPLLFHLLESSSQIADMHLMLQKEVVDRLAAEPGDEAYGRISVMVQYHCHVEKLFTIGPKAFRPVPKVDSAVVRLTPYREPPTVVNDLAAFGEVVKRAFAYRRKTLRNAMKGLLDSAAIKDAGVDPGQRGERLSLNDFARLSNRIPAADR